MATPESRECIGRFEIAAELGRGSMGIVHRAYDPVMGRDVAIKTVLLPHGLPTAQKEEFHTRFLREARAAGRLSHPGIVTVYDFNDGATGGSPFIAMELVDGPTLHDLIHAEGPTSTSWALSVGETLADALQTAHDAGIIHRDLKPANILVRRLDGVAKISDFGVARVNQSELTGVGSTYGSPAYMAPERLRGAAADARSDLFSLAVILYEILSRQRPFGGDDFASTCAAILTEEPRSICRHQPKLCPAFERFFARALAKNPDDRYPTGTAFREALEALRDEQDCFRRGEATGRIQIPVAPPVPQRADPAPSAPRRDLSRPVSTVVLLLLLLGLAWVVRRSLVRDDPSPPPAPTKTEPAASVPVVASPTASAVPAKRPARPAPAKSPVPPQARASQASVAKPAHLDLSLESRVKSGTLTLLLDDRSIYTTALAGARGDTEKITARLDVPAGRHTLVARLAGVGDADALDRRHDFEIEAGATRGLTIDVGRRGIGRRLTLTLTVE